MFCIHCGKRIDDDSRFCFFCGKPVQPFRPPGAPPPASHRLHIRRRQQSLSSTKFLDMKLLVDDMPAGSMCNGGELFLSYPPGLHVLKFSILDHRQASVRVLLTRDVYLLVWVESKPERLTGLVSHQPIEEDAGQPGNRSDLFKF